MEPITIVLVVAYLCLYVFIFFIKGIAYSNTARGYIYVYARDQAELGCYGTQREGCNHYPFCILMMQQDTFCRLSSSFLIEQNTKKMRYVSIII